jgi:uncharacterized membrane protein
MLKKVAPFALVIFSIIGILDAGKITWDKFNNVIPACAPPFQCDTVLNSPWAQLGPLPISAYGLGFYFTFLVLACLLVLEVKSLKIGSLELPVAKLVRWLGVFGFLFTLYLVILMAFIINAWCLYCLISAINCTVLFLISRLISDESTGTAAEPATT